VSALTPTFADAAARRAVRLPDGRTARLVATPGSDRRSAGTKARVVLPSGAHLSFPLHDLTLLPDPETET
jgi:hypothetical protein